MLNKRINNSCTMAHHTLTLGDIPELIALILENLPYSKQDLSSCSLVSSIWLPYARHHLFYTFVLIASDDLRLSGINMYISEFLDLIESANPICIRARAPYLPTYLGPLSANIKFAIHFYHPLRTSPSAYLMPHQYHVQTPRHRPPLPSSVP